MRRILARSLGFPAMTPMPLLSVAEAVARSPLRMQRDRFVALAFCWAELLLELDADAAVVFAAGAAEPLIGRRPEELVGSPIETLVAAEDRPRLADLLALAARHGRVEDVPVRLAGAMGPTAPLMVAGYRLEDREGHCFLALRRSRLGRREDRAPQLGRDEETGLLDADAFVAVVRRRVRSLRDEAGRQVTLVALAGYEGLRDRLERQGEQELMATIGACLRAHSIDGDAAARVAADRFGLIHDAGMDAARLRDRLAGLAREADPAGEGAAVVSATVEVDGDAAADADIAQGLVFAINRFRRGGGGGIGEDGPAPTLARLAREAAEAANGFRRSIRAGDFTVAFQPILDARTGSIHHYEALARFPPSRLGRSPSEHIAFAEETGLIADFDLAMAAKVIGWLKRPAGAAANGVAVNISGVSIGSLGYLAELDALLADSPWARGRLMFEITESARMERLGPANAFIQRLRGHGFPVCLDDFGAGAATFEYLSRLEVDVVKLDGQALNNARRGHKGRAFLKALVALCRELGIATIAEMVEDEAGLDFVRECGVEYVQGHLFGRPAADIAAFAARPPAHLFRRA